MHDAFYRNPLQAGSLREGPTFVFWMMKLLSPFSFKKQNKTGGPVALAVEQMPTNGMIVSLTSSVVFLTRLAAQRTPQQGESYKSL